MNQAPVGIHPEVVAAIVAALSAYLDGPFTVTGITPERPAGAQGPAPSAWAKSGVLESHLMRRQFGLRTR